ncbi:hypothetical protein [Marisediminicola sp. LYQ134]|uniref:hypothetical protein n=1 Tax=Marisediminicola sp. LYQ134 TaxID=3391061 RepID=UPI0039833145
MIETFLRAPRGAGETVADAIRAAGVVSIVVATIGWGVVEFAVFALTLLGLLLPRMLGSRPAFDILAGLTLLIAAWSSVLEFYTTIPGWDLLIHFVANGVIAAMAALVLEKTGILDIARGSRHTRAASIIVVTALGLAFGVVWEIAEWLGHNLVDSRIFVGYDDTIGDLVAGGLGALVSGVALPAIRAGDRSVDATRRATSSAG